MEKFTQKFMDFLNENKQNAILAFAKENADYRNLRETLNKDITPEFEKFKENIHRFYDMESDMLYWQGYKDCIYLLKMLEVL